MPEKYRLVLTLRYLQDLSYAKIATALEVPMGTVKTHLHRARWLLTERLRQWEEHTAEDKGEKDKNDVVVPLRPGPISGKREIELCVAST